MRPKLIKTAGQHEAALQRLKELILSEASSTSGDDKDEMELLAFLVEDYEKRTIQIPTVTPAEAIRFRMEQAGLKQQDLVSYIGSKSRVSEILSGRRELTLAMVRKLHEGLGIPLQSLVQDEVIELPPRIDTNNYPVKEMFIRGYFSAAFGANWATVKERAEELLHSFFGGRHNSPIGAFNRQTTSKKSKVDTQAVHAWRCRVLDVAGDLDLPTFERSSLDEKFFRSLAALSSSPQGPLLAQQKLQSAGVALIIEEHLSGTHLDGAAIWHQKGFPVIALTLRHNRLDNFWFTLFHELGHVVKHLNADTDGFIDTDIDSASEKIIEREADQFALNTFIPEEEWDRLGTLEYAEEIRAAARKLKIHPAIIAGRLRREAGDYRKHRTLIGQGQVRNLFGK